MRYSALVLSGLLLSASSLALIAQTGFTKQAYSDVLPAGHDNDQMMTVDLNNDGRPDLLAFGSRYSQTAPGSVFLNNGSGGFLAPVALPGTGWMKAAQIADLNGDGSNDIVACMENSSGANPVDSLVVLLNNGTGSFHVASSQLTNGLCNAVTLGDVNRDGHLDVVTVGYSDSPQSTSTAVVDHVTTWLNDGAGHLSAKGQTASFDHPNSQPQNNIYTDCGLVGVVGADFAGNGQFSLVLTTQCFNFGHAIPGVEGTAFYGAGNSASSNGNYFDFSFLTAAGEIDTHGYVYKANRYSLPDAAFVGARPYPSEGSEVDDFRNQGNGTFQVNVLYNDSQVDSSYFGDFNGDGYNDLAIAHDPNTSNTGRRGRR